MSQNKKPKLKERILDWLQKFGKNRRSQIIVVSVLVLLTALCVWLILGPGQNRVTKNEVSKIGEETVAVKTENPNERRLDGMIVSPNDANRWPIAIMIENLTVARPQAGLAQAQLVYEALAEGGIPRFVAVFSGEMPAKIGPVRSARRYYLEWVQPLDAIYGHAGGSPQALEHISAFQIKSINGISNGSRYYWRGEGGAPHNLFTSGELLTYARRDLGVDQQTPDYRAGKFQDAPVSFPTEQKFIKVNFSSIVYQAHYKYDSATNDYLRFHGETAHTDRTTGEQIRVKNVVVQKVPPEINLGEKGRIDLDLHGEGVAILCSNGACQEGTWKTPDLETRTIYYDSKGEEYKFTRGNIWIEVLPGERSVEYN